MESITTRSWAFWRRVQYITGLLVFLLLIIGGSYMRLLYVPPNCFDNEMNGEEYGVDCGGECVRICVADVDMPVTQWARSFRITEGIYSAVAYVGNRNYGIGTPEMGYTFKLYDEEGLIAERSGITILTPDGITPIFEGRIATGDRVPTRTFIELEESSLWLPIESSRSRLEIVSRNLTNVDSIPRLDVEVRNNNLERLRDIEVVATIFDVEKNALTASQTVIPDISGQTSKNIVFTWPEPIAKTIRSCELPTDIALAIDLSGSMNNDGDNPPEPITTVLKAATEFVHRVGKRDQVAVVTYATEAELVSELSAQKGAVATIVSQLEIAPESEQGSTNTGDAIAVATEALLSEQSNPNVRKVLILLYRWTCERARRKSRRICT